MKLKKKRCKSCKGFFLPMNTFHVACSGECALKYVEKVAEAKKKVELSERKEKLKSLSQWLKEAQKEFNRFIRLRDADLPCICCNRHYQGQYHAGHYLSVGARGDLRFNEDNCHKQKSSCNNFKSGNQAQYRIKLIKKIGLDRVESLENYRVVERWTIDDIKEIREHYRLKANEMQKSRNEKDL